MSRSRSPQLSKLGDSRSLSPKKRTRSPSPVRRSRSRSPRSRSPVQRQRKPTYSRSRSGSRGGGRGRNKRGSSNNNDRQGVRGRVTRVSDRGFGFLRPDEDGEDVYFHCSGLIGARFDDLDEGQEVEFDMEEQNDRDKPRAKNVRVIGRLRRRPRRSPPRREMYGRRGGGGGGGYSPRRRSPPRRRRYNSRSRSY